MYQLSAQTFRCHVSFLKMQIWLSVLYVSTTVVPKWG